MVKKISFIDLRAQIELLRDKVSFSWVALRSADLTKKCSRCLAVNSQYGNASPSCTLCLGTGHAYIDKLVKAHKTITIPGIDFKTEIGKINTKTQYYYFESGAKPKTSDFVLELDTDVTTGVPRQPFRIISVYKIGDAQPLRGDKGRIEFWKCLAEERNFTRGKPATVREKVLVPYSVSATFTTVYSLAINGGTIVLGKDFGFPITTLAGEEKRLFLQPIASPDNGGELKIATIHGTTKNISLIVTKIEDE